MVDFEANTTTIKKYQKQRGNLKLLSTPSPISLFLGMAVKCSHFITATLKLGEFMTRK